MKQNYESIEIAKKQEKGRSVTPYRRMLLLDIKGMIELYNHHSKPLLQSFI